MKNSFLLAILGKDGSNALKKAVTAIPALEYVILPKCVNTWIGVYSKYEGTVPGTEINLSFTKSESKFTGQIRINEHDHVFKDASNYHLVSAIVTALGSAHEQVPVAVRNAEVSRLSKSVDLLIKAQVLKEESRPLAKTSLSKIRGNILDKFETPGGMAKPKAPEKPIAPTATAPKVSAAAKGLAPKTGPATKSKPKTPTLMMSEKQANHKCSVCNMAQLKKGELVGCVCFRSLIKETDFMKSENGYIINLDNELWDTGTILVFMESIGKDE